MSEASKSVMSTKVSELVLVSKVQTCHESAPIAAVVDQLCRAEVGSIVVVENGAPVGIFTERDYLKKIACREIDKNSAISQFITRNPVCVKLSDSVGKVLIKMRMGRFRHIVVVDDSGKLVNVISIKDVLDFLSDKLSAS
jgi:CBS domain-containing protein